MPIVVAPLIDPGQRRTGLDVLHQAFADGPRRRSATLLLQEYLNASDEALWGLATDGLTKDEFEFTLEEEEITR